MLLHIQLWYWLKPEIRLKRRGIIVIKIIPNLGEQALLSFIQYALSNIRVMKSDRLGNQQEEYKRSAWLN